MLNIIEPARVFQYDYIYVDLIFLIGWLGLLIYFRKRAALVVASVIAPIIYAIDAVWWWRSGVREYTIGGESLVEGSFTWLKFGADWMMTISFSLFMFAWIWIMFEWLYKRNSREVTLISAYFLAAWMLTPFLSRFVGWNDALVETVRHTNSLFWIINFVIGYSLLSVIYWREPKKILLVFLIGASGSLMMELPLLIWGIRPLSLSFFVFEIIFLMNQGMPYLFLFYDKVARNREKTA